MHRTVIARDILFCLSAYLFNRESWYGQFENSVNFGRRHEIKLPNRQRKNNSHLKSIPKNGSYLKIGEGRANTITRSLGEGHKCRRNVSAQKPFWFEFRSIFSPNTLCPRHLVRID